MAGELLAFPLKDGRYGVCQVLAVSGKQHEVAAVDLVLEEARLDEVPALRPLIIDHHAWRPEPGRWKVDGPPPEHFVPLGDAEPMTFGKVCLSYGGWASVEIGAELQRKWRTYPEAALARHEASKRDRRAPCEIELGGKRISCTRGQSRLRLPKLQRADFSALAPLGMLYHLEVTGPCEGLEDWLREHPITYGLHWRTPGRDVDLRGTGVRELHFDEAGPLELACERLDVLHVARAALRGAVDAAQLYLRHGARAPEVRTDNIVLEGPPLELDRAHDEVTHLSLHGDLDDPAGLARFTRLKHLAILNAWHLDPDAFPDLPLASLTLSRVERETSKALKKRKLAKKFRATGTKTRAWIEANIDNPFNGWSHKSARKAVAAFKKIHKAGGKDPALWARLEALDPPEPLLARARAMLGG